MVLSNTLLNTELPNYIQDDLEALFLYGAVGTDDTTAASSNTRINQEVLRKAINSFDKATTGEITASVKVTVNELNGLTLKEQGWFTADDNVIDDCEATTGWANVSNTTISLNSGFCIEGSYSLNVEKSGTTSQVAAIEKMTTSVDFTGNDITLAVYIIDSTTLAVLGDPGDDEAIRIRLGSDSSNYYEWNITQSSLAVGWNIIGPLNSTNADSTTGSPTLTACDYTYLAAVSTQNSDTWSAGDLSFDSIRMQPGSFMSHSTHSDLLKDDTKTVYYQTTIIIDCTEV
jgi:hypothetical protein